MKSKGLLLILGFVLVGFLSIAIPFLDNKTVSDTEAVSAKLPLPEYEPFQDGEKLVYDLSYAFISAGEGIFQVSEKNNQLLISVTGRSYSFFDIFYKVRDYYETYLDKTDKLPQKYLRDVYEGGYTAKENYLFYQNKKIINANGKDYKVPTQMFDIVSCFYYVRCLDFSNKPFGYQLTMNTFFDKEIFPVGVTYLRKEIIKTKLGKFKVRVFAPKLIEGRVFKNQSDMLLYVTDDKNQIPIRIKSAIYLDYVYADLVSFKGLKYPLDSKLDK